MKLLKGPDDLFDYNRPVFRLDTIAKSLSHLDRCLGVSISVGMHSLFAADLAPSGSLLELQMLGHDMIETYVGDMPSGLKKVLPDYMAVSRCLEDQLANALGIPLHSPEVSRLDELAWLAEALVIFGDEQYESLYGIPLVTVSRAADRLVDRLSAQTRREVEAEFKRRVAKHPLYNGGLA